MPPLSGTHSIKNGIRDVGSKADFPFCKRGGGVSANTKNPYQKKLRWSKKGEGGGLNFLTKSKKKQFFFYASPYLDTCKI